MAKKKPEEPRVLPASPPIPLFERPAEGEIAVRVRVAGNNRAAGLNEALDEIGRIADQKSTLGGKERARIKQLLKDNGIHGKALSIARQLEREDPNVAVGIINDVTLILAERGVFDAFEQGAQAEANEANAASVDAAERVTGEPKAGGPDAAAFHQGAQAALDGAKITANPYGEGTGPQRWWAEGWHRENDRANRTAA